MNGQFRGWSIEAKDAKILGLARVIRHFKPVSIHCSISRRDVKALMKGKVPYGFADPYGYVFSGIMVPLAHHQVQHSLNVPIDFIFDEQGGIGEEAKFWYKRIRDMQPRAVRNVCPRTVVQERQICVPLQAADMLAWHIWRNAEKGNPNEWFVPDYLNADDHHIALDYDLPRLEALAEQMGKVKGIEHVASKSSWKKMRRDLDRSLASGYVPPYGSRWKNLLYGTFERIARLIGR